MKRLLVTGARGFVAASAIHQASGHWTVHALSRGAGSVDEHLHWHCLHPDDSSGLATVFQSVRPDAVLHTAALADIDYCEVHQDEARHVNVEFTRLLAGLCATHAARLVFCSSDAIFDGEHAPYREDDPPAPVNYYARTKVDAEQIVARLGSQSVIARLSLVMGLPVSGEGNSFLARMVSALRAGREVNLPAGEVRTPIDVVTLGRALLELADSGLAGIFHLAGNEPVNRHDLGLRIAARFGCPPRLVKAVSATHVQGRARRARDASLDNAKARAALRTPMLNLDDALELIYNTAPNPP